MSTVHRIAVMLLALPVVAPAGGAEGQATLELTPRGSLVVPASVLGTGVWLDDGNLLRFDRPHGAVGGGLAVQVGRVGSPWAVRGIALLARSSPVSGHWECLPPADPRSICPGVAIGVEGEARLSTAVVGPVRLLRPVWQDRIRPYLSLAAGVRWQDIEWPGVQGGSFRGFSGGRDTVAGPALQAGVGAEARVRRVSLVVDIENYAGWFGPGTNGGPGAERIDPGRRLVHDVVLSLGARLRLRPR
jgi:hypothetical protein